MDFGPKYRHYAANGRPAEIRRAHNASLAAIVRALRMTGGNSLNLDHTPNYPTEFKRKETAICEDKGPCFGEPMPLLPAARANLL